MSLCRGEGSICKSNGTTHWSVGVCVCLMVAVNLLLPNSPYVSSACDELGCMP